MVSRNRSSNISRKMTSRIITPPDHLPTKKNILVINAVDHELTTLILWLKTVPDQYDIHVFHSQMPDSDWALKTIIDANQILVSRPEMPTLSMAIKDLLEVNQDRIIYFGQDTEYPDLIQYFLQNRELQV